MPETFKIGRLGKTHGVKGELTFHFTDDVFDRVEADYVFVETEGLRVQFFFEEYRFRNEETALVKFEGIDDATRAAQLTGCDVYFPRELADSDDGELTWTEIVGFTSADSVSGPDGQTVLIPANDELIDDINRQQRCITMRIPEGLLEV